QTAQPVAHAPRPASAQAKPTGVRALIEDAVRSDLAQTGKARTGAEYQGTVAPDFSVSQINRARAAIVAEREQEHGGAASPEETRDDVTPTPARPSLVRDVG